MSTSPSPRLVVFTTAFPYGKAEYFLETEVPYLAARFDRVTLVPNKAPGAPRPVPAGVEVDLSLATARPQGLGLAADSLRRSGVSGKFYREVATHPAAWTHWQGLWRAMRYYADARRVQAWLLRDQAREAGRPTIYYAYWLGHEALAAYMARPALPDLTFVTRAHGDDLYEYTNTPAYLPFRHETFAGLDAVFTVSEYGRRYMVERYPSARGRAAVARLGVEAPGFACPPSSDGVFRLVTCSFMVPGKRLELAIAGLAAFARARPHQAIAWDHLGDGPEREALETLAQRLLPAQVSWRFHGLMPHEAVLAYYRAHPVDAFLNCSVSEGIPVSIMEAQSAGIPVVATAVGGTPEIVDGESGLLLAANPDAEEIARALAAMADGRAHTQRQAAQAGWASRYDATTNYNRFVDAMLSLLPAST